MWYKKSWELLEHFWKMIVCLDIVYIDIWIDVLTVPVWAGRLWFAVRTWDLCRNTSSSQVTCVQSARDGHHSCINCRSHMWYLSPPHFCIETVAMMVSTHYLWLNLKHFTTCVAFFHFYSCVGALNVLVHKYLNALNSKEKHNTFVYSFPK